MKPMEYTPAGYRAEVHGKPTITFNKDGHRYFIFEHEYEGWVKAHKKNLSDAECAAEYWRALYTRYSNAFLDCSEGDQTPDEEHRQHWHEISTWRRFAEHPHTFQGEQQ